MEQVEKSEYERVYEFKFSLRFLFIFIKSNYKSFLILVTFIGGFYQFINLFLLRVDFIKFFSISQLLSDGLIILLLIVLLLFIPFILTINRIIYLKDSNHKQSLSRNDLFYKRFNLVCKVLSVILLLLFNFLVLNYFVDFFEVSNTIGSPFILFNLFIFIFWVYIYFYYDIYKKIGSRSFDFFALKFEASNVLVSLLSLFSIISFILIAFNLLYNGTYEGLPTTLKNIENIEKKLKDKYNVESNDYEVKYFNDKFIFVEHISLVERKSEEKSDSIILLNKKNKIIILPFNDLFE